MFGKTKQDPDYEWFSIYDSKIGLYRAPMLAINRHDILRQIDALFRDPEQQKAQLVQNAEDFSLFKIGEFDKKTGVIVATPHEHIANLHEIRTAVRNQMMVEQPISMRDLNPPVGSLPT